MSHPRATPEQAADTRLYLRMLAVHARQRWEQIQHGRGVADHPRQLQLLQDNPPLDAVTLARERARRKAAHGGRFRQ